MNQEIQLFKQETECTEISVYQDKPLSIEFIPRITSFIQKTFPKLKTAYCAEIAKSMVDNGFTEKRAADSVLCAKNTYKYPEPTMAVFLDFNKCYKTYSWDDLNEKYKGDWITINKGFKMVKIGDVIKFVSNSDIRNNNLEKFVFIPEPIVKNRKKTCELIQESVNYYYELAKANKEKLDQEEINKIRTWLSQEDLPELYKFFTLKGIEINEEIG